MMSLVVIAPAAVWPSVKAMNSALGYAAGDGVELSSDGSAPATHLGLHTWATDAFIAIATGQVTLTIEGYTAQDIANLLAAITVSVEPSVGEQILKRKAHFDYVASSLGLQTIEVAL
jgi:hypothetical protein